MPEETKLKTPLRFHDGGFTGYIRDADGVNVAEQNIRYDGSTRQAKLRELVALANRAAEAERELEEAKYQWPESAQLKIIAMIEERDDLTEQRDALALMLKTLLEITPHMCSFCGFKAEGSEQAAAHMLECPKHPMVALKQRMEEATAIIRKAAGRECCPSCCICDLIADCKAFLAALAGKEETT